MADIDLFAPDATLCELVAIKLNGVKMYKTRNATTVTLQGERVPPVQIIHRWTYDKPEDLIESFDFTVAKSVMWYQSRLDATEGTSAVEARWRSLAHDQFYADLAAKRLTYTRPQRNEDASGSMLRLLKFYQKGYRVPLDSFGAVMARLTMGVNFDTLYAVNHDRETALGQVYTGLLREVDPVHDPKHLAHLPSATESPEESRQ